MLRGGGGFDRRRKGCEGEALVGELRRVYLCAFGDKGFRRHEFARPVDCIDGQQFPGAQVEAANDAEAGSPRMITSS